MRLPVISRSRVTRKLRELGSLVSATLIVLSVCGVALASMSEAKIELPAPIRTYFEKPMLERSMQAHLESQGITRPVTSVARIDVHGLRDRGSAVDLTVRSATPLTRSIEVTRGAVVSAEGAMVASLRGRRVLASVSRRAIASLPRSGAATVRLVAVPQGKTVGLVIDSVEGAAAGEVLPAVVSEPGGVTPNGPAPQPAALSAPAVDRLSAYYGRPGTRITVFGTRFGDGSDGYVVCADARAEVVSWADDRVEFIVPKDAKEPGYVGVSVGGRSSNGVYFVPFDRPAVVSMSPREGAPGTAVTIEGANFGAEQGASWVSFAGASGQVVSWSDTRIKVIVPRGALAGWAGVVCNGLSSNGILYGPYGLPYVGDISTKRLTRGERVTITGRDFGAKPGWVLIGKARVSADEWTDSRITFTVPAGVSAGYLGVLRDDLYTSNGWWVELVPRMTSVSSWWVRPGAELTLTGVGFGETPGDYIVTVGGVPVSGGIVSWSNDAIRITVPSAARSGYVGVGTIAATSNGVHVVVEVPARVAAVSASHAAAGDTLTITGADFGSPGPANRVLIGGSHIGEIVSWSDTTIVARVPAGAVSGYLGVIKQNVSSNGVWLNVAQ